MSCIKTVGIIVPSVDNSFFSSLAHYSGKYLFESGYSALIMSSDNSAEKEKEHFQALSQLGVDGIICVSGLGSLPDGLIPESLPLVWVDRRPKSSRPIPFVANDDCEAMSAATEFLIEKGCRNIILMPGYVAENSSSPRVLGYERALSKHSISLNPEYVLNRRGVEATEVETEELVRSVMSSALPVDAIITSSDRAAFGVITALHRVGLYVPEDVKLISFDNSSYSAMASPAITALDRNPRLLAEKACECLKGLIKGEAVPYETIIPVNLCKRDSTR